MPAWGWFSLALYFVLLVTLGVVTFRKRRYVMFGLGVIFPVLWLIGAVIKPRD